MVMNKGYSVDVLLNFKTGGVNMKNIDSVIGKNAVSTQKQIKTQQGLINTGLKKYLNYQTAGISGLKSQRLLYLDIEKSQANIAKDSKRMDFTFLSQIFGGMALQRSFGTFGKNVISTYREMGDKNDDFNIKTNKLSASFSYLGYTFSKGFAESEFTQSVIEELTDTLNYLGGFFDDNPNIAATITDLSLALGALGTAMVISGQMTTLKMAFSPALANSTVAGALSTASNVPSWLQLGADSIKIGLTGVLLYIGLSKLDDILFGDDIDKDSVQYILGNTLITLGILFAGKTGGLSLIMSGIGLILKVSSLEIIQEGIWNVRNKIADFLSNALHKKEFEDAGSEFSNNNFISSYTLEELEKIKNGYDETLGAGGNVSISIKGSDIPKQYNGNIITPIKDDSDLVTESMISMSNTIGSNGAVSKTIAGSDVATVFNTNITTPLSNEVDTISAKMDNLVSKIKSLSLTELALDIANNKIVTKSP